MRLIDADAFKSWHCHNCEFYKKGCDGTWCDWGTIIGLEAQPTVDAVPVVRCKDCKHYRDGDCWHEWDNDGRIYYQSIINEPNPDDYCSRAERKDE